MNLSTCDWEEGIEKRKKNLIIKKKNYRIPRDISPPPLIIFKFSFCKTAPFDNKILVTFSIKIDERNSKTAGNTLFIRSNTIIFFR